MKKITYAGKIKNAGSQFVPALFTEKGKTGKAVVKTGTDLRTNGGK
jgi:hypothetical protein